VIIHCGVQKTASTSLHHFVSRNRAALSRQVEILTPEKGSLVRRLGRAAIAFSLDPGAPQESHLTDLAGQLADRLAKGSGTVIVSHENLPGAMIGKDDVRTLYPHVEKIVESLQAAFAPVTPEFVFYTRDMADWKNSVYNQAVKSDHYPNPRAVFLTETADCGTWDMLEQRMRSRFGDQAVHFFRLEDEFDDGRPGAQLLRLAGLGADDIAALAPLKGHRNPSLNTGALEFLRLINGLDLDRKPRSRVADLITSNQSLFVSG
jgi:hypothetical protein